MILKENIQAKVKAEDWNEAIRIVGGLLETAGSITPCYTEAMIICSERYGTLHGYFS